MQSCQKKNSKIYLADEYFAPKYFSRVQANWVQVGLEDVCIRRESRARSLTQIFFPEILTKSIFQRNILPQNISPEYSPIGLRLV